MQTLPTNDFACFCKLLHWDAALGLVLPASWFSASLFAMIEIVNTVDVAVVVASEYLLAGKCEALIAAVGILTWLLWKCQPLLFLIQSAFLK